MICYNVIILGLLGSVVGVQFWNQGDPNHAHSRSEAPLNPDGTVAFTPEVEEASAAHRAFMAQEYQKILGTAKFHPNRNILPSSGINDGRYSSRHEEDGRYKPQHHNNGQYNTRQEEDELGKPHLEDSGEYNSKQDEEGKYDPHEYDDGQYDPKYDEEGQYDRRLDEVGQYDPRLNEEGKYKPHLHHKEQQHKPHLYHKEQQNRPHLYHKEQHGPQKNGDGHYEVHESTPSDQAHYRRAVEPEFRALASSFRAVYHRALSRHRRSDVPYKGPPAPLNEDGTVANTPELVQANAAHEAAFVNHYLKLEAAANLAAALPDRTSPPSPDYDPRKQGHHSTQQQVGEKYKQLLFNKGIFSSKQDAGGKHRPQLQTKGPYSPLQHDSGEYKPQFHSKGQYSPQERDGGQFKGHDEGYYNPAARVPAPLNPDGTVAQTPEFRDFFSSLQAAYDIALSRNN